MHKEKKIKNKRKINVSCSFSLIVFIHMDILKNKMEHCKKIKGKKRKIIRKEREKKKKRKHIKHNYKRNKANKQ